MLSSIISSRRSSRLLGAAAAAVGSQLLSGGFSAATTAPTIQDCEVVSVEHYASYSDSNLYAHFSVQWDGTGQGSNTMYFYRGIGSTSPISTTALGDMSNLGASGWETCGVVIRDTKVGSVHTFTARTQAGSTTSDTFYWFDYTNQGPDGFGKADLYSHDPGYEIGVQAYDGSDWSDISWAACADNS